MYITYIHQVYTDNGSEISELQSVDTTSININVNDSRGCNLRSTSKGNISTTMVKQNNLLAIDTDTVDISTTNATSNNQMNVDNIATRMKSNKRRKNKTYNQTRKKSRKTQTQNLDILSSSESPSYKY
jgi:hypothetical protein